MAGIGRKPNGGFGVGNGNKQTFAREDFERLPSTQSGGRTGVTTATIPPKKTEIDFIFIFVSLYLRLYLPILPLPRRGQSLQSPRSER
jgi:hypothetical protein